MGFLHSDPKHGSPQVIDLTRRLVDFYTHVENYESFEHPIDQTPWYRLFLPQIHALLAEKRSIRILELGAGCSSFGAFIEPLRTHIEYHAQDITPQNREHLAANAAKVFIGPLSEISESYDLIFHTWVLEHIATPRTFLEQIAERLAPAGRHIIICPRYDMPGYLNPSLRHLSLTKRLQTHLRLQFSGVASLLDRRPRFWINMDPAVFHKPWYRDSDAIHLVQRRDIERWHRTRGFQVLRLLPVAPSPKQQFLLRRLTLTLACIKVAA